MIIMKTNEFFQKYGGWLLAGLSSIGVVVTAVLAADEAPKAKEAIHEEELHRVEEFNNYAERKFKEDPETTIIEMPDCSLTTWEKVKIAAPILAPSLISGTLTIGTIFGNQALNTKQQAAMTIAAAGYTALSTEYEQYRKAIRETQGEEVDEQALRMAKMRIEELEDEIQRLREENGPYLYSISSIPGLIFEANPADIQEAFLHFNRNLILRGVNDLAELYTFIGIPEKHWNLNDAVKYGWNEYVNSVSWDAGFLDFDIEEVETGNGTVVRMISMTIPPYDLTMDYESENCLDHLLPYDSTKRTRKYIQDLPQIWWDQVVKIDHPYVYRMGLI